MNLNEILADARPARFIPSIAETRKEQRLVSILLAVLPVVPAFAKRLLQPCKVRVGKSSILKSYREVEFPSVDDNRIERPDGVLCIETRQSRWAALLEAKVEQKKVDEQQIHGYAKIARAYEINAVITVSNQLAPLPTHVPYSPPAKIPAVDFFHISWINVLTQAEIVLEDREEEGLSRAQSFLLEEMIEYFTHRPGPGRPPVSGVRFFTRMNEEWRDLVSGIRKGQQFRRDAPEIERTAASWHQAERSLCLMMSRRMSMSKKGNISLRISREHKANPAHRLRDACNTLATSKKLCSAFGVPNAAGDLEVTADLQCRTISCSMKLKAPLDRKRAGARINWLLRQLLQAQKEETGEEETGEAKNAGFYDEVLIRAFWPGRTASTQAPLARVREDAECLCPENRGAAPGSFEVVVIREGAARFSGQRTFMEDLEQLVPDFHNRVGRHLRPWTPPPPAIAERDPIRDPAPDAPLQDRASSESPIGARALRPGEDR